MLPLLSLIPLCVAPGLSNYTIECTTHHQQRQYLWREGAEARLGIDIDAGDYYQRSTAVDQGISQTLLAHKWLLFTDVKITMLRNAIRKTAQANVSLKARAEASPKNPAGRG